MIALGAALVPILVTPAQGQNVLSTTPTTGTVSVPDSGSFHDTLVTTGATDSLEPITYTLDDPSEPPGLTVDSSGDVTTAGTLAVGSYAISGTTTDADLDSGTWKYTLTVTPEALSTTPTAGTVSVPNSAAFTVSLDTIGNLGGPVSYTLDNSGQSTDFTIGPSTGLISTTDTLAAGPYSISGTTTDPDGDTGSWGYTLTVSATAITQITPTSGKTTTAASSSFTDQLETSGGTGAVSFATTSASSPPGLLVSSSGAVSTTGTLSAHTYTISGTDSDGYGDTGSWGYTLTVSATAINQLTPTSGNTTTAASSSFTDQLETSGGTGAVSFATTSASSPPGLLVSSSGAVSTTGTLSAHTYTISGTDSDGYGDTGTWGYTLTVSATAITQITPTSGKTTTAASSSFTDQLETSGGTGAVSFATTSASSPPGLLVSSSGAVSTTGTLSAHTYTISGTDSDGYGDTGSWGYTLTVSATAINQLTPTSGNTTTAASSSFTDQLETSGGTGAVSFATTSASSPPGLLVSSSGAVSTTGTLSAHTYTISGTDSDGYGDTGTWGYTLTVSATAINQLTPTSGNTTTAASSSFTDQLETSGGTGAVSFATTSASSPPGLLVSSSGAVSTTGTLSAHTYTISGTDSDGYGDTGSWGYTLTVSATAINQLTPTSGNTTTAASSSFTDQLETSGGTGAVSFATTSASSPPGLLVSSSGAVSTTGTLSAHTYTISGTDSDGYGDTGTWGYTLTVSATAITQITPTSGKTTTAASSSFTDQLETSGGTGAVSFATTSASSPPGLLVSSSGAVSTTGTLSAHTYTISGTDSDGYGDTGSWGYTLTVSATAITQSAPTTNSTTPAASSAFTDQLETSGGTGAVSFATTSASSPSGLVVSSSGALSTRGTLSAHTYTISGTDSDGYGDTGTWSYSLTVSATAITQITPTSGKTAPAASSAFTDQLKTSGGTGAVSFATTSASSPPGLLVSSSGAVSTRGTLSAHTYTISGTDSDSLSDTGTWSYSVTVRATAINQLTPTSGKTTTAASSSFTDQLKTSGGTGKVTYAQSIGAPDLKASSSGKVSAPATLAAGTYKATGTDKDTYGDTGTWSFTLTVKANKLNQLTPTSGKTTTAASSSFTDQLKTSGGTGTVTYAQSIGAPDLKASSSGKVSAPATLAAGTYKATGTDKDTYGDTGTWSFTLIVKANKLTQIAPATATTTMGKAFTDQLKTSGGTGTVTYAQSTGAPDLKASSSGAVSAPATLAAGTYKAAGTARDSLGDTGSWSFTLTVKANKLTQIAPTTATTTTGEAFTGQLKVSGSHGTVTYAQSIGAPDLKVSSSGAVSAPATLAAGTYKAAGTARDSLGDTGSWSFTLTVKANKLTQIAPATATTTMGKAFTGQLKVSGSHGTVTYAQSIGAPDLKASSSGAVSAPATLAAGTYKAAGTDKDTYGDTGTWSFTLIVKANKLTQIAPATATTTMGKAFTDQLKTSGGTGTVTYAQSTGAPDLKASSSGAVSAPATLAAGTYKAAGTARDSLGDTGSWSFTLTVKANKLTQIAPTTATTTTGEAFTGQLKVSGSHGTVTYAQSTGAPDLKASSSGAVSAPATLAAGTYKAAGTARDSLGDTGSWSFTLTVKANKLTQIAPTTATTTTGEAFTGQLKVSGSHGTVTYAQSTGAPDLKVSSSGAVSAPATLAAGTYKAAGTARDSLGDTGSWSFTLTVKANKLTQIAPTKATTTTGKAFTGQLKVSGSHGTVTYAQSTGAPDLKVSSSGAVSAPATLAAGTYKAAGTARDSLGDTGSWSFTLTVKANKLTQIAPTKATTTTGKAFTGQLKVSGSHGTVTYAQSTGAPDLKVSSSGAVSAPATLAAGTYKAAGTARDSLGDTGTWSFTLTVKANKLTQIAPTKATTTTGEAFTGQLKVSGSHGTVTYAQSIGAPDLKVSSSGAVSAPATLAAGTYKAAGTARDSLGDTGTWSFTLTVKANKLTQVAPTKATTTTGKAFTGQLKVSESHGTVTYAQTEADVQILKVSSSGAVSAPATLAAGTYKAAGTARDSLGDTGTWSFTLTLKAAVSPQDLQATIGLRAISLPVTCPHTRATVWRAVLDVGLGSP
jgi:hypothetical protein